MALGFGASTFRYAARPGDAARASPTSTGQRVATSYPGLVEKHLADHGVSAVGRPARRRRRDGDHPRASPTSSPTSSRPARPCAARASRSSASRSCAARRSSSAASAPSEEATAAVEVLRRRLLGVMTARQLRDDGLRRPGRTWSTRPARSPPGWSRRRCRPCRTASWCAVRAMVPRGGHEPGHGRALRPRRAGHPRHRHRGLPALSRPVAYQDGFSWSSATRRCGRSAPAGPARGDRHGGRVAARLRRHRRPAAHERGADDLAAGRPAPRRRSRGRSSPSSCWRLRDDPGRPEPDGLIVRNLVVTRTLTWAQVVDVRVRRGSAVGDARARRHRHRRGDGDPAGRRGHGDDRGPTAGRAGPRPRRGPLTPSIRALNRTEFRRHPPRTDVRISSSRSSSSPTSPRACGAWTRTRTGTAGRPAPATPAALRRTTPRPR